MPDGGGVLDGVISSGRLWRACANRVSTAIVDTQTYLTE